jgi:hypothetical protein
MDEKGKLQQLDDAAIAEILAMSEDELLEVLGPNAADAMRADIGKAVRAAGKAKLAQARAAIAGQRRAVPASVGQGTAPRSELQALRRRDSAFDRKLTMAARGAAADVAADEPGIEDDLAELSAWRDEETDEG